MHRQIQDQGEFDFLIFSQGVPLGCKYFSKQFVQQLVFLTNWCVKWNRGEYLPMQSCLYLQLYLEIFKATKDQKTAAGNERLTIWLTSREEDSLV